MPKTKNILNKRKRVQSMEKEALFWESKENNVHCKLCPKNCFIKPEEYGQCRARKNVNGKLYSMVYAKPCSVAVDPVEKKPLFHFLPGKGVYSIGTSGCNLRCQYCQNWEISQSYPEEIHAQSLESKELVKEAQNNACDMIAYTYTEPTIFYEYVYDTAELGRKVGLKNIMVTNGYIQKEPAEKLYPLIDGANIDLKGFSEEFYKEICGAALQPVLETIKRAKQIGTWIEITNLVVPGKNDDFEKIREMCKWIRENLGADVPLHYSRFYPCWKMSNVLITPEETLIKAREIAIEEGLNYVYIGNVNIEGMEDTYCPKCKETVIVRRGFTIIENKLRDGKCGCGQEIAGVWE